MKRIISATALLIVLSALSWATAGAQDISVGGTVTGTDGQPVPGAAVMVRGTASGTVADLDGRYTIQAPSDATLVFSSIGYVETEVPVGGRSIINVVLAEDAQMLEETIVVAFGTSTKESFTGSAKVVRSDEIAKSQVTNITSALSGKVAGVQMTSSSGAPESTPSINIRGVSSISSGTSPLIVIDGMPASISDLNNINPSDVESMSVLKDAVSNSLYGARGANGVIIVTTKRSREHDAVITVDARAGVNTRALRNYDFISDPATYYETHFAALYNYYLESGMNSLDAINQANSVITQTAAAGGLGYQVFDVPQGQSFIGRNGKINPGATLGKVVSYKGEDFCMYPDDWDSAGYKTGIRQEYNVSVSGGTDNANVYASLGYLDNNGITENSGLRRITSRLRAGYKAKPWLTVNGNLSYTNYASDMISYNGSTSTGNIWAFTANIAPIYPLYIRDADGNVKTDSNGILMMDLGDGENGGMYRPYMTNYNAVLTNLLDVNREEGNAFTGSGSADLSLGRHFKFTANVSSSVREYRYNALGNPYYGTSAQIGGAVSVGHYRYTHFNAQQILNYTGSFADVHNLNIMAGHEFYRNDSYSLAASKQTILSTANIELNGAITDSSASGSTVYTYNNEGFFTRAQYDLDQRFFLSASYRMDASSRFAEGHRWGSFWSAGAAWLLNKEPALHLPRWVDMLKLKASVGSQGNDNIGSTPRYTDIYALQNNEGELALYPYAKGNGDITWETNTNINAGVDLTLFRGRLDASAEFFDRKTTDMLFYFYLPLSGGYTGYWANVGDMVNYGVELSIDYKIIDGKSLQWSVNANATKVKNRITKLHERHKNVEVEGYRGYISGSTFYGEGLPLYTKYMKKWAGVDDEGHGTWWKYATDASGNTTLEATTDYSSADYFLCGAPFPDWYGGLGTSLTWKNFDFSVSTSYQIGGQAYDSGYASMMGMPYSGSTGTNFHKDLLNAWSEDNTSSDIPKLLYNDQYAGAQSTRFLTNASYLNINNINLGYTFPKKTLQKLRVSSLRLYLSCENVAYWSVRRGFDPRYSLSGSTNNITYSPMRTISGGFTLKF